MICRAIVTLIYGRQSWLFDAMIKGSADLLVSWVLPAIAVVLCSVYRPATPGKIAIGARIVDAETGEQPSTGQRNRRRSRTSRRSWRATSSSSDTRGFSSKARRGQGRSREARQSEVHAALYTRAAAQDHCRARPQDLSRGLFVRNGIDFSSWQGVLSTLLSLAVVTLVFVGIRLLIMQTIQQRRERQNRQINERLRTLIAAYKTLGGSFTGDLAVDPTHMRDLRVQGDCDTTADREAPGEQSASTEGGTPRGSSAAGSDRRRRVRDAVEAALSDVILLGTEQQVRLAARAAGELAAGRPVETAELVVSLRTFIREVLDLGPVPIEIAIPKQGPVRPSASGPRRGENSDGGGRGGAGGGGGQGGGGAGIGGTAPHGNHDADDGTHH